MDTSEVHVQVAGEAPTNESGREPDESRALLLHAARAQFAAGGFGGTTTKSLAAAAGVAEVTLFRQFGSKAALYREAVVEPLTSGFGDIISRFAQDGYGLRPHDPEQSAAYYVEHIFTFLRNHRESLLALLATGGSNDATVDGGALFQALFEQLEHDTRVEAQALGWDHLDVPMATRITFGIAASMTLLDRWFFPTEGERPEPDRVARAMAQYMIHGMGHHPDHRTSAGRSPDGSGTGEPVWPVPGGVRVEVADRVAVVTLDRSGHGGSVDEALSGLSRLWGRFGESEDVRALVLTGVGETFSRGLGPDPGSGLVEFAEAVRACPLPSIAAVDGPAVGPGFALVGLCDLVVMSERAYLAEPDVALACADPRNPVLSQSFVSALSRAKAPVLTGRRIGAAEAVNYGLAQSVVPADGLRAAARDLALVLADTPEQRLRAVRGLDDALHHPRR